MAVKNGNTSVHIIEAFTQKTLPGVRGMEPQTRFHITLALKSNLKPRLFLWMQDGKWYSCSLSRAHYTREVNEGTHLPYTTAQIYINDVKKGDTLELTPINITNDVPIKPDKLKNNTLYFNNTQNNWFFVTIKHFLSKPDIVLP